jgi:hypothetical protein
MIQLNFRRTPLFSTPCFSTPKKPVRATLPPWFCPRVVLPAEPHPRARSGGTHAHLSLTLPRRHVMCRRSFPILYRPRRLVPPSAAAPPPTPSPQSLPDLWCSRSSLASTNPITHGTPVVGASPIVRATHRFVVCAIRRGLPPPARSVAGGPRDLRQIPRGRLPHSRRTP